MESHVKEHKIKSPKEEQDDTNTILKTVNSNLEAPEEPASMRDNNKDMPAQMNTAPNPPLPSFQDFLTCLETSHKAGDSKPSRSNTELNAASAVEGMMSADVKAISSSNSSAMGGIFTPATDNSDEANYGISIITDFASAAEFNKRHRIPSPFAITHRSYSSAMRHIVSKCFPSSIVIKDPLGNSMVHPQSMGEADTFLRSGNLLQDGFPWDKKQIIVEDFIRGKVLRASVLLDGENVYYLPPYVKKDDDLEECAEEWMREDIKEVFEKVLIGLLAEGVIHRGTVCLHLVLTPNGPLVVKYCAELYDLVVKTSRLHS